MRRALRGGRRRRDRCGRDRGAAAIEFALLLPLLLLIIFGIIDFGRALNTQITITQAAREGARLASFGTSSAAVVSRTQTAATGLSLPASDVTVTTCPQNTAPNTDAQVSISYSFSFVTPLGAIAAIFGGSGVGGPLTLTATGVMPCEN
jgi:Flp pilus assembly protein TadG